MTDPKQCDTAELRLTIADPCWKNAVWPREKALALLDEVERLRSRDVLNLGYLDASQLADERDALCAEVERLRGEGDRLEEQLHATVDDLGDVITTLRARVAELEELNSSACRHGEHLEKRVTTLTAALREEQKTLDWIGGENAILDDPEEVRAEAARGVKRAARALEEK